MSPDPDQAARDEILQVVEDLVRRHVPLTLGAAGADAEARLAEIGLDSLATVALMLEIEEGFAIEFPASMIQRETFRSVRTIADAVSTLRRPPSPAQD